MKQQDIKLRKNNGTIIGKATIVDYEDGEYFLTNFEIYPEFRHKGYGTLTLKKLIEEYNVNSLTVNPDNLIALKLYKKFGFKKAKGPYFDKNANETVIYMKR